MVRSQMNDINTLIFDLGGVIINLDTNKTIEALVNLSDLDKNEITNLYRNSEKFHLYEKGLISDSEFRSFIKMSLNSDVENQLIDEAWNAMILNLPKERLNALKVLSESYQLFLLSNTNTIHLKFVNQKFKPIKSEKLDDYFEKAFYSHLLGMRKPDKEIFNYVLDSQNLDPSKTLFLDDNGHNIAGAEEVGIKTMHIPYPDFWREQLIDG